MVNKTYYDILGVAPDASQAAIKKQYRRLALATHPDKNPDDVKAATARFQLLQQAAETLCDPASRSRYDADLRNTARPGKASERKGSSSSSSSSHSASSSSPSGKSKASSSSKFKPSTSSSSPPPPSSSCSSFKTQFPPFRYKNVGGEDVSDKEKKARKRRRYRERQKERRQHRGRKF